jgi:hypothetical protein
VIAFRPRDCSVPGSKARPEEDFANASSVVFAPGLGLATEAADGDDDDVVDAVDGGADDDVGRRTAAADDDVGDDGLGTTLAAAGDGPDAPAGPIETVCAIGLFTTGIDAVRAPTRLPGPGNVCLNDGVTTGAGAVVASFFARSSIITALTGSVFLCAKGSDAGCDDVGVLRMISLESTCIGALSRSRSPSALVSSSAFISATPGILPSTG